MVHAALRVFHPLRIIRVLDAAGEGNQNFHIVVVVCLQVCFDLMVVSHCRQTGGCDHHHLAFPADFMLGDVTEGFHDDSGLLLQVVGMQFFKAPDSLNSLCSRYFWVVRGVLGNLETGLVGGVVLQHIQDEAFLNSLPHGVNVEGVEGAVRILLPEHLQGLVLRRGGKGKEAQVLVLAVGDHLPHQTVLCVLQLVLGLALQLRIFFEGVVSIC